LVYGCLQYCHDVAHAASTISKHSVGMPVQLRIIVKVVRLPGLIDRFPQKSKDKVKVDHCSVASWCRML